MIDVESWPIGWQVAYGFSPFVIGIPELLICIYLGCSRHLDVMLEVLKYSRLIASRGWLKNGGYFGRLVLIGSIAAAVLFPRIPLEHGMADPEDIRNFPVI